MYKNIKKISVLFCTFIFMFSLVGCTKENKDKNLDKIVSSSELWKKNPIEVVSRYVNSLNTEDCYKYVYADMNEKDKIYSIGEDYLGNDGFYHLGRFIDKETIKKEIEHNNKIIKSYKFIGAKPTLQQEVIKNPIKIKDKNGKVKEYRNPIVIEVWFEVKHQGGKGIIYEEGENMTHYTLIQDLNGDFKILSIGM
ncbi:hypothetical protein [Peptostreptococcus faecalis]|uniref:hypothetical protein n=1 Tax=Peptostreptococcus faecalis TaxID=2045015 RepID=UPI000C7B5FFC|nr:hypothetical protein [Peptostreptococcus faecalis]